MFPDIQEASATLERPKDENLGLPFNGELEEFQVDLYKNRYSARQVSL